MNREGRPSAADAAAIAATLAMSAAVMADIEPDNDSYFSFENIPLSPSGGIFSGELEDRGCGYGYGYLAALKAGGGLEGSGYCSNPDTILRTLDAPGGNELDFDDDGSPLGDGLASALFGQQLGFVGDTDPTPAAIFEISGCCDGFDTPFHGQAGEYVGDVVFFDAAGNFLSAEFVSGFWFSGEEVDRYVFIAPEGAASYEVVLDNNFCGGDCAVPDTVLGLFGDDGSLIGVDDNSSPVGDGSASALLGFAVPESRELNWMVSGFNDFDFDGMSDGLGFAHGQLGGWEAYVTWYDIDGEPFQENFAGSDAFYSGNETYSGFSPAPEDAVMFDLYIDNTFGDCVCDADVDFYELSGLTPGATYEVRLTNSFADTYLGAFDAAGNTIVANDDDPVAGCCLSVIEVEADGNGLIRIGVTGYFDEFFAGAHSEADFYDVEVTPVETGCNLADVAVPFGTLDIDDVLTFLAAFANGEPAGDVAAPFGTFDIDDVLTFLAAFAGGCPQ